MRPVILKAIFRMKAQRESSRVEYYSDNSVFILSLSVYVMCFNFMLLLMTGYYFESYFLTVKGSESDPRLVSVTGTFDLSFACHVMLAFLGVHFSFSSLNY